MSTKRKNPKAQDEKKQEVKKVVLKETSPRRTPLEEKVNQTLKKKHSVEGGRQKGVMNKVLLNFPNIQHTFRSLHSLYELMDEDHSDSLEIEEIRLLMDKMNTSVDDKMLIEIFNEANVGSDGHISFREFLTCLGLGFLLDIIPESSNDAVEPERTFPTGGEVRKAFAMATEMYLSFDVSESGLITYNDMVSVISGGDESEASKSMKPQHKTENNSNPSPMVAMLSNERW